MVDRRTVLKLGASGIGGALFPVPVTATGATTRERPRHTILRALYDGGSVEGLAFATEMRAMGVAASPVRADLAKLWYGDLQAHLRKGPATMAGLTDRATLFCLEELARSAGMRVRYRVEHQVDSSRYVRHDAVGPTRIVEGASQLDSRFGYGSRMALVASEFEPSATCGMDAQKRTGPFAPENATVLVSWVMA
jgi:hypothetical protein